MSMISNDMKQIGAQLNASAKNDDGKIFVMQWLDEWQIHLEKTNDPVNIYTTKAAALNDARSYIAQGMAKKIVIANKKGELSYL